MHVTGKITYQDLEGGFWGIIGDDGQKYHPVDGLPAEAQKEGQRVEAELEAAQMMSFAMWGRTVRVRHLTLL